MLGICYGMQLIAHHMGGEVRPSPLREYGRATLHVRQDTPLFAGLEKDLQVWMSHGDGIHSLPEGFEVTACLLYTSRCV